MSLTDDDVQDVLRLIDDLEVNRLRLRTGSFELLLRRGEHGEWTQSSRTLDEPVLTDAPPAARENEKTPAPPVREGLVEVRTPLPGAFYRAPKPGAPPFVEVGDQVTETSVVAIVETMKLMNPVYAGGHGTVAGICFTDGEFAEQGAVLMHLEPATS